MVLTHRTNGVALLIFSAIVVGLFHSALPGGIVYGVSSPSTPNVYIITINTTVSPKAVFVVGNDKLLLIGTANGSSYVELLDVSDPYVGGKVLQIYPMVGSVTAVATNGYPVERVAVGTDRGDLAVFKPSGGRIYLTLHAVLGTDFSIEKLVVMKGSTDYKIAALASESSGYGGGPCTSCHVYVFDEDSGNVLRIGPQEGNASVTITGVLPQDITAALEVTDAGYYYNASKFMVTWLPKNFYTLTVNVTYRSSDGTIKPAANQLIELTVYNPQTKEVDIFGVNAGANGVAEAPVPYGFDVNISVTDSEGNKYVKHVEGLSRNSPISKAYVQILMNASPQTLQASLFYRTPKYELAVPHILNVDDVPHSFTFVTSLNDAEINPASTGLTFLQGSEVRNYVLYYYDPSTGYAHIRVYRPTYTSISEITDYVGKGLHALRAFTYPNIKVLITAYKEGSVKTYNYINGFYYFLYEIKTPGTLNALTAIPSVSGYFYTLHSSGGLQIVEAYPYQVPLLRVREEISFGEGSVTAASTSDLSTVVIAFNDKLQIIKNLNTKVVEGKPLNLKDYVAPSLTVDVSPPPDGWVNGTEVTLYYPGGNVTKEITSAEGGSVSFPNIIPGTTYALRVKHPEPYVKEYFLTFTPINYSPIKVEVKLRYRIYSLKLEVRDSVSGSELKAPYDVLIDGEAVATHITSPDLVIPVRYGTHKISVQPSKGYENVYNPFQAAIQISSNTSLKAQLTRKTYPLTVMVVDKYTTKPLGLIKVSVAGYTKIISFGGTEAIFDLPYGNYTVTVGGAPGYQNIYVPVETPVSVTKPSLITVVLKRHTYVLNISIRDSTVGKLASAFDVSVNGSTVASNVKGFTNITLPYGTYMVSITPSGAGKNVYVAPPPVIVKLHNDTEAVFKVARKFYKVKVYVTDDVGAPLKDAEVTFFSIDKNSPVSTLITDESGYVYATLFYGAYDVTVETKGFFPATKNIAVDRDLDLTFSMQPQPLTLIMRYLPVIAIVIIAVVVMVAILKVKAKIVERLPREELF